MTRVRAVWPNYGGWAREIEISPAYALEESLTNCAGMLPSPYDVIDITPIYAAEELKWKAGSEIIAPLRAAAIAREETTNEFVLYGLGGVGLEMALVANVHFPSTPADSVPLHLALALMPPPSQATDAEPWSGSRHGIAKAARPPATATVFVYQEASLGSTQQPARLFIGDLKQSTINLQDSTKLFNLPTPQLEMVHMVVSADKRHLVLLGHDVTDKEVRWQLWKLDLDLGKWTGSARLGALDGRSAFSLAFDSERAKLVVFGGIVGGKESDAVVLVDTDMLVAEPLRTVGVGPELARAQAGSFVDPATHRLYVCGGRKSAEALNGCWQLDLVTLAWSPLGHSCEKANGTVEPMVVLDPARQRLWLADRDGANSHRGIAVCVREPNGQWYRRTQRLAVVEADWPVQDNYLPGTAHAYVKKANTGKGAGQLFLVKLETKEPELGLKIYDHFGRPLAASEQTLDGATIAAFFCPRGQDCQIAVAPGGKLEPAAWSPFVVNAINAEAINVKEVTWKRPLRDFAVQDALLFVTDGQGLSVLNRENLSIIGEWRGNEAVGADHVAVFGDFIYVSQPKFKSISVVDVSNPQTL